MRGATAQAHEALDRLFSRFNLAKAEGYGAFLLAHAPAYIATERALDKAGAQHLIPGWRDRLRSASLLRDIAALGLTPPSPAPSPAFTNDAQLLGGLYVLEGSRLGGAMLVRRVAKGLPTAFLAPGNPADWRAFISLLDQRLSSAAVLADAISAAQAVFSLFERSARDKLEPMGIDC